VRENRSGTLYCLTYGLPISYHVDPIEKKPLFHFYPGSTTFSFATAGCNFRCLHCQNHEISQIADTTGALPGFNLSPEQIVTKTLKERCRSISYTYTEPTIFFEYAFDVAKIAHEKGLANVFVTNGYIEDEPLTEISPYLNAANIDLKGFSSYFYSKVCGAHLEGVLDTIRKYKSLGIWIEITTLIIPGYNDNPDELKSLSHFIASEIGPETPWHVSAFYPTYHLTDVIPTPAESTIRARQIGLDAGLKYVYTGNIPGLDGESTVCYYCGKTIIKRWGFTVTEYHIASSHCKFCGANIDGVGL
jgi:pyruvate formate lyase activating enzyme